MSLMTAGAAAWQGPRGPALWVPIIDLPFEGMNGSTTFTDLTGRSWDGHGNAQISTAEFVEGSASLLLDGSGDYLTAQSTADVQAQGDFRIECWVRPADVSRLMCIASKRPAVGSSEFFFYLNGTGQPSLIAWDSDSIVVQLASPLSLTINQWRHVAIERVGTQWSLIVGGAVVDQATQTKNPNVNNELFYIGRDRTMANRDFDGYIDRFRFLRP